MKQVNVLLNFQTDIVDHNFAVEWMQDFEVFEEALSQDTTYMSSLTRSMSLVLDEFYQNLRTVGVSSMTGAGFDEFLKAVDDAVIEFETQYKPGKTTCDVMHKYPRYRTFCPFWSCLGTWYLA